MFGDEPVRGPQGVIDLAICPASIEPWRSLGDAHDRTIPDGDPENGERLHTFTISVQPLQDLGVTATNWMLRSGDATMQQRAGGHCLEKNDHFDGKRFVNPTGTAGQPFSAVPRMLLEPRAPWPARVDEAPQRPPGLDGAAAVVTFIGHSTFLIQTAAGNILTDPMYSGRAGPLNIVGPRRVRQPAVPFDDLPPISTVLLSHNHYDHCDLRTLGMLAERFDSLVVTPLGNGALVRSAGIRRVEELDWWEAAKTSALPIALTPAQHFSARGPLDRNLALWGGFTLVAGGARIFFAGDTAYAPFFRDVRQRLGPIHLALLPIGAYEPRWFMQIVHMNPAEAVQAHVDLEASESVGMHFGTFQLTSEGIDEPLRALEAACRARNIPPSRFRTLRFGESVRLTGAR